MLRYTGHKIFLNGKLTDISSCLEEYMEGQNIYEVIRIIDGKILFWEDHFNRLVNSLRAKEVNAPFSEINFPELISILIRQNMFRYMNIRLDVFISESINVIIGFIPSFYPEPAIYNTGVKTVTLESIREDPAVKVVHHDLKLKVDHILENQNVYEVLLINELGNLTEGSRTNLFFIKGEEVVTPESKDVLSGVTRNKVIELCRRENICVTEGNIGYNEIHRYDACFITGTSPKVLPVTFIDGIGFKVRNSILLKIMNAYNLLINRSLYNVE
ncbi:aminotransferase class IV [Saccharicrinis sp. FJH62]|uniref:aminotransferase class IV n=1 Tax=Saccharicrinis sp. FJH62 TaxID=3344657 RepID=UPI0035D4CAD7